MTLEAITSFLLTAANSEVLVEIRGGPLYEKFNIATF